MAHRLAALAWFLRALILTNPRLVAAAAVPKAPVTGRPLRPNSPEVLGMARAMAIRAAAQKKVQYSTDDIALVASQQHARRNFPAATATVE